MASVIINCASVELPSVVQTQETPSVKTSVVHDASIAPPNVPEPKPIVKQTTLQWFYEANALLNNVPDVIIGSAILLLILCLVLFVCSNAAREVQSKDATQCIKIVYSQKTGQYGCIDWDMQLQPMIGARRVMPHLTPYTDHLRNLLDLYVDSNQKYFVASLRKYDAAKILEQPHGVEVGMQGYPHYRSKLLYGPLHDCILLNTVGKNCTMTYSRDVAKNAQDNWTSLLYYAMLDEESQPLAFTCKEQSIRVGPFVISESRSQLLLGDMAHPIGTGVVGHLKHAASNKQSGSFVVGDRHVGLTIRFESENEFSLHIELSSLPNCHQSTSKYTLNTPHLLIPVA